MPFGSYKTRLNLWIDLKWEVGVKSLEKRIQHMEEITLSLRLHQIASWVIPNRRVADIGGDHGWLLLSIAKKGKLEKGIIGEVNQGPYENAKNRIASYQANQTIDVRLGDGLEVIAPGEVDQVIIAGMGGALISSILDAGQEKLMGVDRLILQPNIGGYRVRQWLFDHSWKITHEEIVQEADIYYEIIVAERGIETAYEQEIPREVLEQIGPLLWKNRDPLLLEKLEEELEQKRKVLAQLQKGQSEQANKRREILVKEIKEWEQMKQCLLEEKN